MKRPIKLLNLLLLDGVLGGCDDFVSTNDIQLSEQKVLTKNHTKSDHFEVEAIRLTRTNLSSVFITVFRKFSTL